MTMREYDMALRGHNRFHGGGGHEVDVPHLQAFIAATKQQYPDNPA